MTRTLKNIAIGLLLVVVALFILQKTNVLPSWKNLFTPKAISVKESAIMVQQVKSIAQLMTIETYDEVIIDSSKQSSLSIAGKVLRYNPFAPLPLFEEPHLVLIMKGRVIAGIDMQKMNENAIRVFKDSVAIRLPKAEILDVIVNPSDVETFAEKGTWTPGEVTAVKQKGKQKILNGALQQNVLQLAEEKAFKLVKELLQNAGYKKVGVYTLG